MAGVYPANRATGNGGCGGATGGAAGGATAGAAGGGIIPAGILPEIETPGVMGVTCPVGGIGGPNSDSLSCTGANIFTDSIRQAASLIFS